MTIGFAITRNKTAWVLPVGQADARLLIKRYIDV